ncbi:NADH-cytochrome b5 reductase [Phytophthora cinnamomi]|uniref:NADH-cytochrome b5 reductase n=1 Tax=Phytophthora cinnamomi TaxID=4785 RepID=UPI00355A7F19|nr:NADH-cytochrome b5 reductase [Phytophthora cinnamomi]
MDLLDAIRHDVLTQKEEEAVNFFSTVSDLRTFIAAADPAPVVNICLTMCCVPTERLNGDSSTRVTVTDANQRGVFEGLTEFTPSKRKQYITQLIVWDAKGKKGYASNTQFRPGGFYKFRQVDGGMSYADTPSGCVQCDRGVPDKIIDMLLSSNKRKSRVRARRRRRQGQAGRADHEH